MIRQKNKKLLYFLIGISLVLVALSFANFIEKPLEVQEFDVKFNVDIGGIGIDLNDSLLTFGQLMPAGAGRKDIVITNMHKFPIKVDVLLSKNLFGLIDVETGFIIPPAENKTISVRLNIPSDFELGNYTGKIKFEIYKAK